MKEGILITERGGRLLRHHNGVLHEVSGLPAIRVSGQGGLLDVATDPNYKNNRRIYFSYAEQGRTAATAGTAVAVAELHEDSLKKMKVIFRALPKKKGNLHFGSRLLFAPDGSLFISLGDRGDRPSAQDIEQHHGSLIRIHADGGIPADNPFTHDGDVLPEIYSYGHRNMQGLTMQPGENCGPERPDRHLCRTMKGTDPGPVPIIWAHEHGPMGGDELNRIEPGQNYGWPIITYGVNYGTGTKIGTGEKKAGMKQPVYRWVPSIATSGLAYYDGNAFPQWRGNLLVGSLKFGLLVRLELTDGQVTHEERMLQGKLGRIRDVRQGPDGLIYILTDDNPAVLVRLQPDDS